MKKTYVSMGASPAGGSKKYAPIYQGSSANKQYVSMGQNLARGSSPMVSGRTAMQAKNLAQDGLAILEEMANIQGTEISFLQEERLSNSIESFASQAEQLSIQGYGTGDDIGIDHFGQIDFSSGFTFDAPDDLKDALTDLADIKEMAREIRTGFTFGEVVIMIAITIGGVIFAYHYTAWQDRRKKEKEEERENHPGGSDDDTSIYMPGLRRTRIKNIQFESMVQRWESVVIALGLENEPQISEMQLELQTISYR